MSSSGASHIEQNPIHPIKTFQYSNDYPQFEVSVIRPFLHAAQARSTLFSDTPLEFSAAPGRLSIEDIFHFLDETDHNHGLNYTRNNPSLPENHPITTHPIPICPLAGYISKRHPDCFVLEGGFFEKGSEVIFGSSGRLAKVLGVCGLGRNYVMMRVQELGGILEGETAIQRMVVSSPPTSLWLVLLQLFVSRLFKPVLGSMNDFVDEDRVRGDIGDI